MSEIEVVYGEAVTFGKRHNRGTLVLVGGEQFIEGAVTKNLYVACGDCSPAFSGFKTHYAGIFDGVCFQCNGRGFLRQVGDMDEVKKIVKRRVAARARAERKRNAAEAAAKAAAVEWREAHPAEAAALAEVMDDAPGYDAAAGAWDEWSIRWGFAASLAQQAQHRPLSEKQTALVLKAVGEAKAAAAAEQEKAASQRYADAEKGDKVAITGRVAVAMNVDTVNYATGAPDTKRLVIVEGVGEFEGVTVKAFGTGKTLWEAERDTDVVISGTVKDFAEYDGTPQTILTRAKVAAA